MQGEIMGITVLNTVEIPQAAIDLINHAAAGRQMANSLPGQDDMDQAYGYFFGAWKSLVNQYFGDFYHNGEFVVDWMIAESAGWDGLGTWDDIKWYLSQHVTWIAIVVD